MIEHNFKKNFGQNFISDKNLLLAIVDDAGIVSEDEVLEIGAGAGSLTQALSQRAKKVVSYEIDKELEDKLTALNLKNVEFCFADIMKVEVSQLEKKFQGNYKLVANLPYYITSPIIFKFLSQSTKLTSLTIMVQKEVAQRIVANYGSKDYGVLSIMVQFFGEAKLTRNVSRNLFYPRPNVDSAIVHIKIKEKFVDIDKQSFFAFVQTCFSMRRKTLKNNLLKEEKYKTKLQNLSEEQLVKRAEDFSLEQLIIIYKLLNG